MKIKNESSSEIRFSTSTVAINSIINFQILPVLFAIAIAL